MGEVPEGRRGTAPVEAPAYFRRVQNHQNRFGRFVSPLHCIVFAEAQDCTKRFDRVPLRPSI